MTTGTNDPLCVVEEFVKDLPGGDCATLQQCGLPSPPVENAQKDFSADTDSSLNKDSESVATTLKEDAEGVNDVDKQCAEEFSSSTENPTSGQDGEAVAGASANITLDKTTQQFSEEILLEETAEEMAVVESDPIVGTQESESQPASAKKAEDVKEFDDENGVLCQDHTKSVESAPTEIQNTEDVPASKNNPNNDKNVEAEETTAPNIAVSSESDSSDKLKDSTDESDLSGGKVEQTEEQDDSYVSTAAAKPTIIGSQEVEPSMETKDLSNHDHEKKADVPEELIAPCNEEHENVDDGSDATKLPEKPVDASKVGASTAVVKSEDFPYEGASTGVNETEYVSKADEHTDVNVVGPSLNKTDACQENEAEIEFSGVTMDTPIVIISKEREVEAKESEIALNESNGEECVVSDSEAANVVNNAANETSILSEKTKDPLTGLEVGDNEIQTIAEDVETSAGNESADDQCDDKKPKDVSIEASDSFKESLQEGSQAASEQGPVVNTVVSSECSNNAEKKCDNAGTKTTDRSTNEDVPTIEDDFDSEKKEEQSSSSKDRASAQLHCVDPSNNHQVIEEVKPEDSQDKHVNKAYQEKNSSPAEASASVEVKPKLEHRLDPPSYDNVKADGGELQPNGGPGTNETSAEKPDPPEMARRTSQRSSLADDVLDHDGVEPETSNDSCMQADLLQNDERCDTQIEENVTAEPPLARIESSSTEPVNSAESDEKSIPTATENSPQDTMCDLDDDDYSYEEIVLEDDEEVVEYVDEILDEYEEAIDDSSFTEVTYDSKEIGNEDLQQSRGSITIESSSKRAVIKSSAQKALEKEEARKRKEAEETRKNMEFRLARQHSFAKKDEDLKRRLAEEEARHIQEEEEREQRRIAEQERLAELRAQEAAARIAQQQTAELRRRLEEEETRRKLAEAEAHRLAAEAAAKEKAEAERIRREAEEAEHRAREEKKRQMEEEVRILQEKLADTKRAAEEAKAKQMEEKKRMQAMVDARRKEKKLKKKKKAEANVPAEVVSSTLPASKPEQQVDLNSSASSVRASSPSPLVSKLKHQVSPLRPVGIKVEETTPTVTAKSPSPASPRRFAPSMQSKCASPLKMQEPLLISSPPAPKAARLSAKVSNETNAKEVPEVDVNKVYYTAEQLRKQSVPGLDYKNREKYLHPKEFQGIFEVTPTEFYAFPKWKQTNMKRKKKLF